MAKRLARQCVEFAKLKTISGPLMTPICGALIVSPWRAEMLIASDLNSRFQRDLRVRGDLAKSPNESQKAAGRVISVALRCFAALTIEFQVTLDAHAMADLVRQPESNVGHSGGGDNSNGDKAG